MRPDPSGGPWSPVRLVLDTNTVVSGLLWSSAPARLLDAALDGRVFLFTSKALMLELTDVLGRSKFSNKRAASLLSVDELVSRYAVLAQIVEAALVNRVSPDPDDDHVLACAIAANAQIVVSGDRDLLNLKYYHGTDIFSASSTWWRIQRTTAGPLS